MVTCPEPLLTLRKPGEASPTADNMEPGEDKCITVPGIKWADQSSKSEPGLLATTYLKKQSQEKSRSQVEKTEQGLRGR